MDPNLILASLVALKEIVNIIKVAKELGQDTVDLKDIEAAFAKADAAELEWDDLNA